MTEYNLEPGEFVIMQAQSVRLGTGSDSDSLDEVVLTNQNLILVASASRGLFNRVHYLKRCALSKIVGSPEAPQVMTSKQQGSYYLNVAFEGEAIALRFLTDPKRTAQRWAEGICHAAAGDFSDIRTEEVLPSEVADLVDGAKSLIGAFTGGKAPTTHGKSGSSGKGRAANVTKKCLGCRAPLTGQPGTVVTCDYCDTKQTL